MEWGRWRARWRASWRGNGEARGRRKKRRRRRLLNPAQNLTLPPPPHTGLRRVLLHRRPPWRPRPAGVRGQGRDRRVLRVSRARHVVLSETFRGGRTGRGRRRPPRRHPGGRLPGAAGLAAGEGGVPSVAAVLRAQTRDHRGPRRHLAGRPARRARGWVACRHPRPRLCVRRRHGPVLAAERVAGPRLLPPAGVCQPQGQPGGGPDGGQRVARVQR